MEGIRNKELIDYIEQNKVSCARIDGVFLIGIKDVDIIIDRVKNYVVLADVMQAKGEPLPDYELDYCNKCMQMTNHLDGICQKCKGNGV